MPSEKETNLAAIVAQQSYIDKGLWHCCYNCTWWQAPLDLSPHARGCIHFGETPPHRVLLVGCEDWIDYTQIPF